MGISQQIHEYATEGNYLLLRRFSMPTIHGPRDAIAVSFETSKILLSFYTIMVGIIMLHLWYLFVLFAIAIAAKSRRLTRNMGVANVAIWNSQAAPLSVVKAMFDYRSHIPLYAFVWACAALLAWAGSFTMSLFVAPELIIGAAAPANMKSIYIPQTPSSNLSSVALRYLSLQVPSNLRAIEVLGAVNSTTGQTSNVSNFNVIVEEPQISADSQGRPIYRVDYSYGLSGVDFGLQHLWNLQLDVQGSCYTEYNWYASFYVDPNSGVTYDTYFLYGQAVMNVSQSDGKPPLVTFYAPENQSGANISYAAIISSVDRRSFTQGTDPWYLTKGITGERFGASNMVLRGRPVLSCWQQDTWTLNGISKPILEIDQLGLPSGLIDILQQALGQPRIIGLAQALGTSALKSAATSQGYYFDAGASSLYQDVQRLVLGAYVATKNTMPETTMFEDTYQDIPNFALDPTAKQFKPGVADFVIYGSGFAALSVLVLIIIPTVTVLLWLVVYLLRDNQFFPLPWAYVNALKAQVLYSAVDMETFRDDDGASKWKRTSQAPYYEEKNQLAVVRPTYNPDSRMLSWESERHGQTSLNGTSDPEGGKVAQNQQMVDAAVAASPVASPLAPP
ncbi:hypothetical protein AOQ84DRAFT_439761 [Glonium stellatum]|uniref:Uncharacterized protein n=1 Tax=Glonium stellatum TaxID=574774 RepID=A0A8E2JSN8_9PEZI|nr:hypothetical protein AOQ84DRAFT_439761 [Glonium stellatum]